MVSRHSVFNRPSSESQAGLALWSASGRLSAPQSRILTSGEVARAERGKLWNRQGSVMLRNGHELYASKVVPDPTARTRSPPPNTRFRGLKAPQDAHPSFDLGEPNLDWLPPGGLLREPRRDVPPGRVETPGLNTKRPARGAFPNQGRMCGHSREGRADWLRI